MLSLYPRTAVGLAWAQASQRATRGSTPVPTAITVIPDLDSTNTGLALDLFVPLLWRLRPGFFVGWGPHVHRGLAVADGGPPGEGADTILGAGAVVGGTWGGERRLRPARWSCCARAPPVEGGQASTCLGARQVIVTRAGVARVTMLMVTGVIAIGRRAIVLSRLSGVLFDMDGAMNHERTECAVPLAASGLQ